MKIINEALKRDLHIQGYNDTEILAVRDTEELRKYSAVNRLPYKIVASAEEVVPKDPYKLIALTTSEEREKNLKFQREVIAPLAGKVQSFFSNDRYQEIVPEGISKGFAVRWFCDYVGVPIENPLQPGMRRTTLKC